MGPWSVVRWVRAASFASACAGLATLGHMAGGGTADRSAALAGFLIVFGPALVLTGRERSLASILPATATSQIVLHVLLMAATGPRTPASPPPSPLGHASAMDMDHGGFPGPGMLLTHAVSVLVTSAWLQSGEARLCALVRLLVGWALRPILLLLLFLTAGRTGVTPRPVGPSATSGHRLAQAVLRHAVVRRGPPGTCIVPVATA